jgi:hypothetical protein
MRSSVKVVFMEKRLHGEWTIRAANRLGTSIMLINEHRVNKNFPRPPIRVVPAQMPGCLLTMTHTTESSAPPAIVDDMAPGPAAPDGDAVPHQQPSPFDDSIRLMNGASCALFDEEDGSGDMDDWEWEM